MRTSIRFTTLWTCGLLLNASCEPIAEDLIARDFVPGERRPGVCPGKDDAHGEQGEVRCSDQVTQLYFSGAAVGDRPSLSPALQSLYATATHGTQVFTVWRDRGRTTFMVPVPPPSGWQSEPCLVDAMDGMPFCAKHWNDQVMSLSSAPPFVTVHGVTAGQDDLRIMAPYCPADAMGNCTDPPGNMLYDRVPLDIVDVDHIHVVAPPDAIAPPDHPAYPSVFAQLHDYHMDTPIAFAKGSQPSVVVIGLFRMTSGDAVTRVVDTSQRIAVTGARPTDPTLTPTSWDSLVPGGRFDQDMFVDVVGHDEMGLEVPRPPQAIIRVVDQATRIERAAGTGSRVLGKDRMLPLDGFVQVCFSPYHDDPTGRYLIHGAWLTISATVSPPDSASTTPHAGMSPLADSCIGVVAHRKGCVRISVNYGDVMPSSFSVPAGTPDACSMAARLP